MYVGRQYYHALHTYLLELPHLYHFIRSVVGLLGFVRRQPSPRYYLLFDWTKKLAQEKETILVVIHQFSCIMHHSRSALGRRSLQEASHASIPQQHHRHYHLDDDARTKILFGLMITCLREDFNSYE